MRHLSDSGLVSWINRQSVIPLNLKYAYKSTVNSKAGSTGWSIGTSVSLCLIISNNESEVSLCAEGQFRIMQLPQVLAGGFKYRDTGSRAGVPGAVGVSCQDTVAAGRMLPTESCG